MLRVDLWITVSFQKFLKGLWLSILDPPFNCYMLLHQQLYLNIEKTLDITACVRPSSLLVYPKYLDVHLDISQKLLVLLDGATK